MISKLSEIHENTHIGENVTIEAFTSIHEGVEIGEGTWRGANVTIYPGAKIVRKCRVYHGAVNAAINEELKFQGEESTDEIGNNTTIRECVTMNRGTIDKKVTKIGDYCLLMA